MKGLPAVVEAGDFGDAELLDPGPVVAELSAPDPATFVREHAPTIKAVLRRKFDASEHEVEDALSGAMLKALKRWSTLAEPGAWVYYVAARDLREQLKKNGAVVLIDDARTFDADVGDCSELVAAHDRRQQLLALLTEDQRHAMAWLAAGYPVKDIAVEMGRSADAVDQLIARSRKRLKEFLATEDPPIPQQRRAPSDPTTILGETDV